MVSSRRRRCITAIRWSPGTSPTLREPVCRSSTCGRDKHGPDAARAMRPLDGADWLCALTIDSSHRRDHGNPARRRTRTRAKPASGVSGATAGLRTEGGHRRRHRCRGTRHLPEGYGARSASSQHLRICPALVLHSGGGKVPLVTGALAGTLCAMAPRIREVVPPVGSRVTLEFGGRDVVATVIEDRGPLAGEGRRLLRVRVPLTDTDPIEFEIPAAEVRVAARSPTRRDRSRLTRPGSGCSAPTRTSG